MLQSQHVLVIEDEPLIALDLEQALSSAGAAVVVASTITVALQAAEAPALTAAIVDLSLHGCSVSEVVERLIARNIAFIFYSGHAETPTAAPWASVPILVKPVPADQVIDMLARVVSAKSARATDRAEKQDPK